jgi:peptidoglycan biosynthesis protein MviN/MurJ (putative lipid II flippase)
MERLDLEGLKRSGAVLGGSVFVLSGLLAGGAEATITVAGCVGAGLVALGYHRAEGQDTRPTWEVITIAAWVTAVLAAMLIFRVGFLRVAGGGIGLGLALSLLNYGIRGPISPDAVDESGEQASTPADAV